MACNCGGKAVKVPKVTPKKVTPKKVTPKAVTAKPTVTNKSMSAHLSKLATIKAKAAAKAASTKGSCSGCR